MPNKPLASLQFELSLTVPLWLEITDHDQPALTFPDPSEGGAKDDRRDASDWPDGRIPGVFEIQKQKSAPVIDDEGPDPITSQFFVDHFEFAESFNHAAQKPFITGGRGEVGDVPENTGVNTKVNTAALGDDGRPDPGDGPADQALIDIDPDPAPPPVTLDVPPETPTNNGRPVDALPRAPTITPPSPLPGNENADFGRPPDVMPDIPPDTGPLTSYTSGGPAETSYNVTIEFVGIWTNELQAGFLEAADYLSFIILADLPDAIVDGVAVDDITITATLENIDGVGGVLGSAGPRELRSDGTLLPSAGAMTFDSADAQNQFDIGNWETIVLHEMIHPLGFGTLWSALGLTSGSVAGGDIRFTGVNATDVYQTEFPGIAAGDPGSLLGIPVETDGGPGTAGGHWDEILFGEEIMTGFVDTDSFVSVMTIASLEDMGYDTVFDSPYSATDLSGPIPADPLLDLFT